MEGKKVLLFGLGFFQRGLLRIISQTRGCIAVDSNGVLLERFQEEYPDLVIVEGEASSIVTWKKINLDDVSHIVSSLQDYDVVLEICRIAREVYQLDVPIIILWYGDERREDFEKYRAKVINPMEIGVEAVMNLIDKNYSKPANIGLGQGEIVEVSILRRSHIVGRKMRYLQPSRWRVTAAYREGRLIIPDGDFMLKIGDRAILIGDPKVIENIVNILMKGTPEFPLQYGQTFAVLVYGLAAKDVSEMAWFAEKTRARKFLWYDTEGNKRQERLEIKALEEKGCKKGGVLKNYRSAAYLKDTGILAISGMNSFSIFNSRMRYFFKKSSNPFLISRGASPYSEIIVSLNGKIPDRLIEIGSELSALLGVPFTLVYAAPPGALKTLSDEKAMKERQALVNDFENLTRSKVNFVLREGNPVKETLKIINKKDMLLLVSADSGDPISLLSPHTSYLLAARSGVSVLVLPEEESNE